MDETGHSGGTGSVDSGSGGDARDRTLLNGWAAKDSPWSNAGAALDPEEQDVPAWRRPGAEVRPFAREPVAPEHPPSEIRPFTEPPRSTASRYGLDDRGDSGFVNRHRSGEIPPFGDGGRSFSTGSGPSDTDRDLSAEPPFGQPPFGDRSRSGDVPPPEPPRADDASPPWSSGRARYSDLLAHLSPNDADPARPTFPPGPPFRSRPDTLQSDDDQRRADEMRAVDAPPPSSAPPYPYEGDLDDARRDDEPPPVVSQRAPVPTARPFPAVRPATPGGRRVDWSNVEPARHALEPNAPIEGSRRVDPEPGMARSSYDPSSFPRRLPYEPTPVGSAPPDATTSGYAPPSGYTGRSAGDAGPAPDDPSTRALPQRVPAEPDVPTVPEPPSVEPPAETPALARIATHLRRGDVPSGPDRQEGFDVNAILAAVKEVEGVRDASLRATPAGAHSLRLDLAEGADPAEVSRQVARLLQDRMGLDAAMQGGEAPASASTAVRPVPPGRPGAVTGHASVPPAQPVVPTQAVPAGRAPVSGSPAGAGELPWSPQAGRTGADVLTEAPEVNGPAQSAASASVAAPTSGPAYVAGSAAAGQTVAAETVPAGVECGPPGPLAVGEHPGPRVVIENVQVNTFGTEATVEVRLAVGGRTSAGVATGPAVDGYLLRLCALATTQAVDELLMRADHVDGPARCFVEHAASVPFGSMQVAVVVLLLSCGGWVEQLAGSAVVTGDDRHAMVRATLAAVNRRLEALLS